MSFKYYKDSFDFAENYFTIFQRPEDLFDPLKNGVVFNSEFGWNRKLTVKEYFKILETICTKENLKDRNLLSCLINKNCNGDNNFVYQMMQKIINGLEEHELPIIPFCIFEIPMSRGDVFTQENYINFTNTTNFRNHLYLATPFFYGTPISINENFILKFNSELNEHRLTTINQIIAKLKEVYNSFLKVIKEYPTTNSPYIHQDSMLSRANSFINSLLQYSINGSIFLSIISNTGERNGYKNYTYIIRKLRQLHLTNYTDNFRLVISRNNNSLITLTIAETINTNSKEYFYKVFEYSTNVPSLLPGKQKKLNEGTPIYIGVELEVATSYSATDLIDKQGDEIFFLCKKDSSITGNKPNKVELVTRIGSIKYIKEKWAQFFNNIDYKLFDTTVNTNNGMHVHIGRDCFDDDFHVRNFAWMINNPANTSFMLAISERGTLDAMKDYCAFISLKGIQKKTIAFKDITKFSKSAGRHSSINFKDSSPSSSTVEVRIFKGIVSFASILKNLEFVEALFEFSRSLTSYTKLNLDHFVQYILKSNNNKYVALKQFLKEINCEKLIAEAQVKEIIYEEKNSDQIVKLINKSNLILNEFHLEELNKKRTKYYIENGKLKIKEIASRFGGLDDSLAKRFFFKKKSG